MKTSSFEDAIALSLANFELHRSIDISSNIKDTEEYEHYLQTQNSPQIKNAIKELRKDLCNSNIELASFLLDVAQVYQNNREVKLNKYEMKERIHILEKIKIGMEENENIKKQIEKIKKENLELEKKLKEIN